MKHIYIYTIYTPLSLLLLFGGCSSKLEEEHIVGGVSSSLHTYNDEYGVVDEEKTEELLEKEELVQENPVEVLYPKPEDPNVSYNIKDDPEAVTEDKIVIPPPVIIYKYPFDPNFYPAKDVE
jgi:hypothetical protein